MYISEFIDLKRSPAHKLDRGNCYTYVCVYNFCHVIAEPSKIVVVMNILIDYSSVVVQLLLYV